MEMLKNFSETFLSVWNKGILGVDIFQILIGIGIFLIFLIFRGLISKLIIKKLEIISNFFIISLLKIPLKIKKIKKIPKPINI